MGAPGSSRLVVEGPAQAPELPRDETSRGLPELLVTLDAAPEEHGERSARLVHLAAGVRAGGGVVEDLLDERAIVLGEHIRQKPGASLGAGEHVVVEGLPAEGSPLVQSSVRARSVWAHHG